ncbi:hypothetical protein FGO68_gene12404 [Halteria grandinella]|uniref:Uncharacterized protein n=1 Tax=Halteria grandinella TaxID=5974 RepID=A0A8J8NXE0_HALGN|nr:hypothetical protein FGO68_gene12404 [Halteria grandinella]
MLECPAHITQPKQPNRLVPIRSPAKDIILSMKYMREHYGMSEATICGKCSKSSICKLKNFPFSDVQDFETKKRQRKQGVNEQVQEASSAEQPPRIEDLQNALLGIYSQTIPQQSQTDSNGQNESGDEGFVTLQEAQRTQVTKYTEAPQQQSIYSFQDFMSASIVLQNLELIYDDLVDNGGIVYKQLINEMVTALDLPRKNQELDLNSHQTTSLAPRHEQIDRIDSLILQLSEAKNRKEKRRLLAEYNQSQELVWGSSRSLTALQAAKDPTSLRQTSEHAQKRGEGLVFNRATKSYVERELIEECMRKESISANPAEANQKKRTQVLSKNQKLHSINVYEKTKKFEYKINLENEKQRQIFRDKMSQKNQLIEENMHVIEAIEEGKRVAAYFQTEDEAREFVVRLAEAKEFEQRGYAFEEIEKGSKLQRDANHKVIPSREELSMRITQGAVNNKLLSQEAHNSGVPQLEGDDYSEQKLIGTNTDQSQVMTKTQRGQMIVENSKKLERTLVTDPFPQDSQKKRNLKLKKPNSDEQGGGFVISKAKPLDNTPEKAQENQKKELFKKIVGVDDRYIAENYYQSNDMDELLYERDGDISRMRQFDYKIHKYRPIGKPEQKQEKASDETGLAPVDEGKAK